MNRMIALSALTLLACADTLGPGRVEPSTIEWLDEETPPLLTAPNEVATGIPFTVGLGTFHGSCDSDAGTTVTVEGRTARIEPLTHTAFRTCNDRGPRQVVRTVGIQFDEAGEGLILLHGWSAVSQDTVTLQKAIFVR